MSERARYVLVEAAIQPRLLGGRAAAGDITHPANAALEVERGLRMRLAPQGITGTSYLEIDYVDPSANPCCRSTGRRRNLHPERAVDGDHVRQRGLGDPRPAAEARRRGHRREFNRLMVTTNERVSALDTKAIGAQTSARWRASSRR